MDAFADGFTEALRARRLRARQRGRKAVEAMFSPNSAIIDALVPFKYLMPIDGRAMVDGARRVGGDCWLVCQPDSPAALMRRESGDCWVAAARLAERQASREGEDPLAGEAPLADWPAVERLAVVTIA